METCYALVRVNFLVRNACIMKRMLNASNSISSNIFFDKYDIERLLISPDWITRLYFNKNKRQFKRYDSKLKRYETAIELLEMLKGHIINCNPEHHTRFYDVETKSSYRLIAEEMIVTYQKSVETKQEKILKKVRSNSLKKVGLYEKGLPN